MHIYYFLWMCLNMREAWCHTGVFIPAPESDILFLQGFIHWWVLEED